MKIIWFFIGICLPLGVLFFLIRALGYLDAGSQPAAFLVDKGENLSHLAYRLETAGIIRSQRAFRWYVTLRPPRKPLQRGEFPLSQGMPIPEVVRVLTEGRPMEYKLTIPEGLNLFEIAKLLEEKGFAKKADFLAAAKDPALTRGLPTLNSGDPSPSTIEGYIFPDTYLLQRVLSAGEIARLFVGRFRKEYKTLANELSSSATVRELGLTPHQVITFASIVEKETGASSERPMVAGVFLNRMRKKMRLQTDPTVIYGVWLAKGEWDGDIRRKDLNEKNPYNTYQIDGLPPGPISNPGISAIRAVLNPADNDFLFFVSKNDGTHVFTKDYRAHSQAVRDLQLNPTNKNGKSWRDLPSDQRAH